MEVYRVLSPIEYLFDLFPSDLEGPHLEDRGDLALLDPVINCLLRDVADLGDLGRPKPDSVGVEEVHRWAPMSRGLSGLIGPHSLLVPIPKTLTRSLQV